MAEYIEKAELMSLIESEAHRWGDDYDWWQCLADVEDFKPADVRPVVRGRWERHFIRPKVYADLCWHCSNCGFKNSNGLAYRYHNFCPNCGAAMMGGDAE